MTRLAMPADRLLPEDSTERCAREFLSDARIRVDDFMAAAGLTEQEHHAYWLRVGYLKSWRDIAKMLLPNQAKADLANAAQKVVTIYRGGHRKLTMQVVRTAMWWSPLHPSYAYWRAGEIAKHGR